jgi:hypothetical protein
MSEFLDKGVGSPFPQDLMSTTLGLDTPGRIFDASSLEPGHAIERVTLNGERKIANITPLTVVGVNVRLAGSYVNGYEEPPRGAFVVSPDDIVVKRITTIEQPDGEESYAYFQTISGSASGFRHFVFNDPRPGRENEVIRGYGGFSYLRWAMRVRATVPYVTALVASDLVS